jgi:NTP pyrophosphatase (non-canonical NTP hydrolase)
VSAGEGAKKGRSDEELRLDLADEAADVLGHILLFAHRNDLDLSAAIKRKWLFRPEQR